MILAMTQALADIVNYYIHDLQEDDIILYQQLYQPKKSAVAQIIIVNATFLCVYRLRNQKYLDSFLDEVSGTVGITELLEIYNLATKEPYSLLYINLVSPKINDMFCISFNQKHQISY
jgi:hypothetical protein